LPPSPVSIFSLQTAISARFGCSKAHRDLSDSLLALKLSVLHMSLSQNRRTILRDML
jgi:hypothetical protein